MLEAPPSLEKSPACGNSRPWPARVLALEAVLRQLRETARAHGVASLLFVVPESSFFQKSFEEMKFSDEDAYDFQRVYYQYDPNRSRGSSRFEEEYPRQPCTHLKFGTENRKVWGQVLPALLGSLQGLPVRVSQDVSWRWDHQNPNALGRPRYIPVYQLFLVLDESGKQAFDPQPLLDQVLARHCMADHPLADAHLFDWQQEVIGKTLFNSYRWTKTGFEANFHFKKNWEEAQRTLFKGMTCSVRKEKSGSDTCWVAAVDLNSIPQVAQPAARDE